MRIIIKKKKERIWMPKTRAATFKDKRTKRNSTRNDRFRTVMKEHNE